MMETQIQLGIIKITHSRNRLAVVLLVALALNTLGYLLTPLNMAQAFPIGAGGGGCDGG